MTHNRLWSGVFGLFRNRSEDERIEVKPFPTKDFPGQPRLYILHIIGRCTLCGLYVEPSVAAVHLTNCHPGVTIAVASQSVN